MRKCSKNVENESRFCPACGTDLKMYNKRSSSPFQNEDIQENKMMAVLAYFGFLVFIPLFAAKRSKCARYHVKQGLILLAAEILFAICYCILTVYFLAFILYCEDGQHGTLSVSSAGGDGDSERDEWKSKEAASDWQDSVKRNYIGQKSLDRLNKSSKR